MTLRIPKEKPCLAPCKSTSQALKNFSFSEPFAQIKSFPQYKTSLFRNFRKSSSNLLLLI